MPLCKLIATASTLFWIACSALVAIPQPNGPYGVAHSTMELINPDMIDPYAPTKQHRRLMISAFYPTTEKKYCQSQHIPYMPSRTASFEDQEYYASYGLPNGTFASLSLTVCARNSTSTPHKLPSYPVILFSPGLGDSRLLYNIIAQSLAAQGLVVLAVDHPYDADVVEFPDGSMVFAANISDLDQINTALAVRTKDILFLADQVHNLTVKEVLLQGLYGTLDANNTLTHGHSLGGATAAEAMLKDHRIRGGINLDGTYFGPVVTKGFDRPFMMMGHEGKNQSNDASWAEIWPHLKSSKVQTSILGTQHASFQDFPVILDVLGLRSQLPADQVASLVGTINGTRMMDILSTYTTAFFDFVGGQSPASLLLTRAVTEFPEVKVVNSTLLQG